MSASKPRELEPDAEGWSLRPPEAPKTRRCLQCEADFESAWAGERICKDCKKKSSWKNGGA